ncbi:MAG: hypothetical protein K6A37_00735 [Saccharofermentans sp.]|nr:hypothetical protein [Saccharofermentans sp.]
MSDNFNDKMNRKLKRTVFKAVFFSYFFSFFFPLLALAIVLLIIGIFKKTFAIIGVIILAAVAVLSLIMAVRMLTRESKHKEFEQFRKVMNGENPFGELESLTDEWGGRGLYTEHIEIITEEGSECKTVREVFEVYKKYCLEFTTRHEDFCVYVRNETYFGDDEKHFVISFDRMREFNDDLLCHLCMDVLYPEGFREGINTEMYRSDFTSNEKFFDAVEKYLTDNGLIDLQVDKINIGTDE